MPTIDESVVKLSLDDSQFDKASDRTISKLDELKRSLQFNGAVEGFKEIEKAAKQTDFTPMEKGVQAVSNQFNALYTIADRTFRRMTDWVIDHGTSLIKSLSIDNVVEGWNKYADKTSAVQTIMASTADQFEDTGEQMDYVEGQLEKLNWFTDETSYKFLDMANNIGKFTANEVGLDDAVTAMQGISNWAAISGAGIRGASMAMYNLAQAISMGSLKLQDWRSIELANMGTSEFKRVAMEAGEAAGELIKVADGVYKTVTKGTEVTTKSFRNSLAEGWLTTDVLMDTLNQYGAFTNELYKFAEETDMSATPLIRYINEYKEGTLDMEDAMKTTGLTADKLTDYLERLGSEEYDLGRRALIAAQEAKTFQEAVDAVKEAVGTGWAKTFELMFGNYEEAKKLWSDFAEGLYEVFVESGNMRNGLLRDWKALGGRTYLIEGIYKIFGKLKDAIFFFKDTFEEIFPQKTAEELVSMTKGFQDLVEILTPSENTINAVHSALTLLLTVIQKVGQVALVTFAGLEPIWQLFAQIGAAVIGLVGDISKLLGLNLNNLFSQKNLIDLYKTIYSISSVISNVLRGALLDLLSIIGNVLKFGNDIWTTFKNGQGGIKGFVDAVAVNFTSLFDSFSGGNGIQGIVNNAVDGVKKLFNSITSGQSIFSSFFMGVYNVAQAVLGPIALLIQNIFNNFKEGNVDSNPLVDFFKNVGESIEKSNIIGNIGSALDALLNFVSNLIGGISGIGEAGEELHRAIGWFVDQFGVLWDWFVDELTRMNFRDIVDVLILFGIFELINAFKLFTTNLAGVPSGLTGILTSIRNVIDTFSGNGLNTMTSNMATFVTKSKYLQMAAALVVLVDGLQKLSTIDTGKLGTAVAAIVTVMGILLGFMKVMEKLSSSMTFVGSNSINVGENNSGNITNFPGFSSILQFAVAIRLMAGAVATIGDAINSEANGLARYEEIIAGIIGLGAIMTAIGAFCKIMETLKISAELSKVAGSLVIFSLAITALMIPLGILVALAAVDIPALLVGVGALSAMMIALSFSLQMLLKNIDEKTTGKRITAAAIAMGSMAVALTLLSASVFALSQLKVEELAQGLISVIVLIIALSTALGMLTSGLSSDTTGKRIIATGIALISMAVAIDLLAAAMYGLSKIPFESLGVAIGAFVVAIVGLSVAAIVAQKFSVGLGALALMMVSAAASFALFAIGVKTLVEAASEFVVLAGVLIMVGNQIGDDFPAMVKKGFENVEVVFHEFLRMIPNLVADMSQAAASIIIAIAAGIIMALPDILNAMLIVGQAVLDLFAKFADPLLKALIEIVNSLAENVGPLIDAIGHFVEEVIAGAGAILYDAVIGLIRGVLEMIGLGKLGDKFATFAHSWGDAAVDGFSEGLDPEKGAEAGSQFGNAAGAGIRSALTGQTVEIRTDMEEAGAYTAEGFAKGIEDNQDLVSNAAENMVNGLDETVRRVGEINSPSGLTQALGNFFGEGFILGIEDKFGDVNNAGFEFMGQYFDGMMTGLEQGGNRVGAGLDAFYRFVGAKVDNIKHKMDEIYGIEDLELTPALRKQLDSEFNAYDSKKVKDDAFDIGSDFFTALSSGLSSGSKKSGGGGSGSKSSSTAEKVKTAAEEIIESYESALKELDYLDKKYKGEYDLYKALNPDLNELQQNARDWEYVNKQIEVQLKRTEIAEEKYHKIAKAMGEASQEARDAEIEWVQEQVTLAELRQEATETQAKIIGDAAVRLELEKTNAELTYNLWEAANQNASEQEKLQQKLVYITKKLAYASNEVAEAEKNYAEAVEIYGENSEQANQAANELLQTQIDFQNTLNEHIETEKSLRETYKEDANLKLEVAQLEYDIWEARNKQATEEEKLAKRQELHEKEYQKALADREKAYTNFELIVRKCGASSKEAEEAYKEYLEADYEATQKHQQLIDDQIEALDLVESKYEAQQSYAEAVRELWKESNENASLEVKRAKEALDLEEDLEYAYTQLVIIDQKIANALKDHAETSEEVVALKTQYIQQQTKILQITKQQKEMDLTRLNDAKQELEYEKKRLELNERIWEANNQYATDTVKNAHELEKTQSNIVMAQKELNNLSKEYAYMVEKYGEASQEARDALYEYESKLVDILELQNSIKETYMDMIDSEAALLSAAETRANLENELWEALNADADEATSKANKLSYQMQSLEMKTDKLRNASKKYNYALKMYGEEAAETQELYNDMLQAQIDYAKTFNEIKTLQLDTIEKNNEIIEQLQYSEKLLDYGFNMWDKLNSDISDAQKIEAEIAKLNKSIVLQVQKANYYGAEWRKAVSQYGQNSVEAQEAYLNYLESLYNALDTQSSIAEKEEELVKWREENNKKLQDAWDEIKTPDLAGGTSVYDELLEMGLSEAEIEAYVKEKAGYIEDAIGTEMDFSIETMQSKAEDALRQWGLTWVDGTFDTAATVVTNTSNCMGEMTDIIAEGAAEGEALAEEAMAEIEKTAEEGAEELVETTEEGMDDMADAIESKSDEILEAFKSVIDEMIWWGQNGANDDLVETGHSILYTIGQSMITNKWSVIDRIIEVMEEAIWWAKNQDYESIGSYLTQGIGQGITRDKWNVINAMVTVVEDAIWAANQAAEIRSPSRVTMWTGEMLDAGVVTGIENRAGEIAKSLSSAVQNGILAMNKIIHTSNTLDFAGDLIADGIMGGIEGYSYNIMAVGKEVLNSLADEYDEYVDDLIGDNQWLIDALREYGFDESTHGIDFVVNLDTTDAKTRLEQLFSSREEDLEYYDDLLDMKEKNAQKDQSDLVVRAEAQAINRELNRVANAISSYEKQISDIVSAGKAARSDDTIAAKKLEYVQNIYSTKPLSALDIYRNTNSQLLRFTAWR